MRTYKLNPGAGSHTGIDCSEPEVDKRKERTWGEGELIVTDQDLSRFGDKFTLVSETDALVTNPETPVEETKKKAK